MVSLMTSDHSSLIDMLITCSVYKALIVYSITGIQQACSFLLCSIAPAGRLVCCVLITLKLDKCKCFSELASVFPNIFLFLPTAQQKQIYLLRWPNDNDSLHCRNVIRLSQMALLVTSFLLAACLLSLL